MMLNLYQLDLSKYIFYTYGTLNSIFVGIQPDSTSINNDPPMSQLDGSFEHPKHMVKLVG